MITVCVGVPIGLFAGYVGGKIDSVIMRIIDVFMAMPVFIVALAIAGTMGASGAHLSCPYRLYPGQNMQDLPVH